MKPESILIDQFIAHAELARQLGVKPATLKTWRYRSKAPPRVKIGGRVWYRRSTVLEWLAAQEAKSQ